MLCSFSLLTLPFCHLPHSFIPPLLLPLLPSLSSSRVTCAYMYMYMYMYCIYSKWNGTEQNTTGQGDYYYSVGLLVYSFSKQWKLVE